MRLGPLVSPITFRQPALVARMAEAHRRSQPGPLRARPRPGLERRRARPVRHLRFRRSRERARLLADGIERIRRDARRAAHPAADRRRRPALDAAAGRALRRRVESDHRLGRRVPRAQPARSRSCAREIGRDPRAIRRSVAVGLLDRSRRGRSARRAAGGCSAGPAAGRRCDVDVVRGRPRAWAGWSARRREIVAALRPLADAGVDLAILGHYDQADVAALELIASDVMPALR